MERKVWQQMHHRLYASNTMRSTLILKRIIRRSHKDKTRGNQLIQRLVNGHRGKNKYHQSNQDVGTEIKSIFHKKTIKTPRLLQ